MEGKIFGVPLVLILLLVVMFSINFVPMVLLHNATQQTLQAVQTNISQQIINSHTVPEATDSAEIFDPEINDDLPVEVMPTESPTPKPTNTPTLAPRRPLPTATPEVQ